MPPSMGTGSMAYAPPCPTHSHKTTPWRRRLNKICVHGTHFLRLRQASKTQTSCFCIFPISEDNQSGRGWPPACLGLFSSGTRCAPPFLTFMPASSHLLFLELCSFLQWERAHSLLSSLTSLLEASYPSSMEFQCDSVGGNILPTFHTHTSFSHGTCAWLCFLQPETGYL